MDFSKAVAIQCDGLNWQPSPMPGVERKPLAREDAERGHATSIVRYAKGSVFRPHPHPRGEEILVLEGTFCDESGAFPAGTYFRNPPGSSHAPFSPDGCVLFVKLHQFQELDAQHVVRTFDSLLDLPKNVAHRLHHYQSETADLIKLDDASALAQCFLNASATEILVIQGELTLAEETYSSLSWLRVPAIDWSDVVVNSDTVLWVKQGHF
ncbi:cupin domain-containing protein [Marinomonas ostreistagni]|uniref:cupin domain-containing protein n=1 Tax=Marinomonas ostreistagni TaxID=359209 RepID=UPI001EF295ED|nr:cupin domain-containing protein [Marinomonas ostreistagni]